MSDDLADTLYVALISDTGRLKGLRRLQYRCASSDHRCLLLDAIAVPEPEKVLLHQKKYKFSDSINLARSSESGRAKNTSDGETHWLPRSFFIGRSALAFPDDQQPRAIAVQCDHVGVLPPDGREVVITAPQFRGDWSAGHAEIRIRADGTRFVVL